MAERRLTSVSRGQIRRHRFGATLMDAGWQLWRVPRTEERGAVEYLLLKLFEVKIDYRRDVERDELRNHQAADNHQPERPPRRTIRSVTQRDGHCAKHRRQRGHQDRAKS